MDKKEQKKPEEKKTPKKIKVHPVPNMCNKDRVLNSVAAVGEKYPALGPWSDELSNFIKNRL